MPVVSDLVKSQLEQGVILDSSGVVSGTDLHFNLSAGGLELEREGMPYRTGVSTPQFYLSAGDGRELIGLDPSSYAPLHRTMRNLAGVVGEDGKARVSKFRTYGDNGLGGPEGWQWVLSDPVSLDTALNEYRFAELWYNPSGTPHSSSVKFFSDTNPKKETGRMVVKVPAPLLETTDISKIERTLLEPRVVA